MDLQTFFPYRLARLAEVVSQATAQVYGERFHLSRDEWRVLAALSDQGVVKTTRLIATTTLDKMRASRAITRLEADGLVARSVDPDDGRGHLVALKPAGLALVRRIVPMVRAREATLLEALSPLEREQLASMMDRVHARATRLVEQG
jgi:DNA-binding MarR family transcriptional regulator